jgi:hypothetical protein
MHGLKPQGHKLLSKVLLQLLQEAVQHAAALVRLPSRLQQQQQQVMGEGFRQMSACLLCKLVGMQQKLG